MLKMVVGFMVMQLVMIIIIIVVLVVVVYMEINTKSRFGSGGSFLGNYNRSSDDGGNIRGGSIMVLIVIKEMVIVM